MSTTCSLMKMHSLIDYINCNLYCNDQDWIFILSILVYTIKVDIFNFGYSTSIYRNTRYYCFFWKSKWNTFCRVISSSFYQWIIQAWVHWFYKKNHKYEIQKVLSMNSRGFSKTSNNDMVKKYTFLFLV